MEQLFRQCAKNIVVEEAARDGVALAGGRTLLRAAGAGLLGIERPERGHARSLDHAAAAMRAGSKPCEQDRPVGKPRRHHCRIAGGEPCLNSFEQPLVDDHGNSDLDDLTFGLLPLAS